VRRVPLVLALVALLLPITARPSWACTCNASTSTPGGQVRHAAMVFTGTVTSISTPLPDTVDVYFKVDEVYKGTVGRRITLTTPMNAHSACHFDFRTGGPWTVFAAKDGSTTSCSGNVRGVINAKGYGLRTLRSYGEGHPLPRGGSGWPWIVWAGLAVALSAGGLLVIRMLRGRGVSAT